MNSRKVDQILPKEIHVRKEIQRNSYAVILPNGTGTIKRVDQFNTEDKNMTTMAEMDLKLEL